MFDFLFGSILAALLIRGWVRGLVREALNLVSLVAGVWIAFRLSRPFGDFLTQSFGVTPEVARIGAGIGLFILFGITMSIAAHYLSKPMSLPGLETVNRVGGAAVALAWGVFLILVFINIARVLPLPDGVDASLDDSAVAEAIAGEDAIPQGLFEGVIGDRAITALASIQDLFGTGRVVPSSGEVFDIPQALLDELLFEADEGDAVLEEINRHRTGKGLGAWQKSDSITEFAEGAVSDAYTTGRLGQVDDCAEALGDAGVLVGECDTAIALASTTLGTLDAILDTAHGLAVIENPSFDRAGVVVVEGPTGRILLVVAAG